MGAIWEFRVKKGHFEALVSALLSIGCRGHFQSCVNLGNMYHSDTIAPRSLSSKIWEYIVRYYYSICCSNSEAVHHFRVVCQLRG